jgi:hypothetical protein
MVLIKKYKSNIDKNINLSHVCICLFYYIVTNNLYNGINLQEVAIDNKELYHKIFIHKTLENDSGKRPCKND